MSPLFHKIGGDIKYIKFEILQIVSQSEDVKFSNVRGLHLRKYGSQIFALFKDLALCLFTKYNNFLLSFGKKI